MTDAQYAVLTQGRGCQEPKCNDTRAWKIYWAMQMRLCTRCYKARFCPLREISALFKAFPGLRDCLVQHRWERGKRYKDISSFLDGYSVAFDRPAVEAITEIFSLVYGKVDPQWHLEQSDWVKELTQHLERCEEFFRLRNQDEDQKRSDRRQALTKYLEERAAELDPPLSEEELHNCLSFHKEIAKVPTSAPHAVWQRLQPKIELERSDLCQVDSSDDDLDDLSDDDLDDSSDDDLDEQIRMMNEFSDELRMSNAVVFNPNIDPGLTEDYSIDESMIDRQPMTAPYAVVTPRRATDHIAGAGEDEVVPTAIDVSSTGPEANEGYGDEDLPMTGMNVSDAGFGSNEMNGGPSAPTTGRVPWPATVAFPWYAEDTVHPRHREQ